MYFNCIICKGAPIPRLCYDIDILNNNFAEIDTDSFCFFHSFILLLFISYLVAGKHRNLTK